MERGRGVGERGGEEEGRELKCFLVFFVRFFGGQMTWRRIKTADLNYRPKKNKENELFTTTNNLMNRREWTRSEEEKDEKKNNIFYWD